MKKTVMFLALCLLGVLSACSDTATLPNTRSSGSVDHIYTETFNSIDDVTSKASHMVKAKLLSTEDFDGYVTVYEFKCIEDYTQNTEKTFYMYDANNEQYVLNHEYYLFLESADVALYPHTIYTTVYDALILDASLAPAALPENPFHLAPSDVEAIITVALQQGRKRAVEPAYVVETSDSTNITELSEEADVVAKVKLTFLKEMNRYTTTYQVELLEILKGESTNLPASMSFPPHLDISQEYYIFLKEIPASPGNYMIFANEMPVAAVTESTTSLLNLN